MFRTAPWVAFYIHWAKYFWNFEFKRHPSFCLLYFCIWTWGTSTWLEPQLTFCHIKSDSVKPACKSIVWLLENWSISWMWNCGWQPRDIVTVIVFIITIFILLLLLPGYCKMASVWLWMARSRACYFNYRPPLNKPFLFTAVFSRHKQSFHRLFSNAMLSFLSVFLTYHLHNGEMGIWTFGHPKPGHILYCQIYVRICNVDICCKSWHQY